MATQKELALEAIKQLKPNDEVLRELGHVLDAAQNSETPDNDGSLNEGLWTSLKRVELAAKQLSAEIYAVTYVPRAKR